MTRARPLRPGVALAALAAASLLMVASTDARAQRRRPVRGVEAPEVTPDLPLDLRGRFGLDRIESLLGRDEAGAAVRAIERARSLGTPEALALVAPQRDPLAHVRGDGRAALALVRALAEHADDADARHALGGFVTMSASGGRRDDRAPSIADSDRFDLARGMAAVALAASGEGEAIALLQAARMSGGLPGRAALVALRAYPPSRIEDSDAPLDEGSVSLASASGDLRTLPRLARAVAPSAAAGALGTAASAASPPAASNAPTPVPTSPTLRARLLESLAELGDTRALALARAARREPGLNARVGVAAARVLTSFADPEAAAACAALVKDDATAAEGIELARAIGLASTGAQATSPAVVDLLRAVAARLATSRDVDQRRSCLVTLGTFRASEAIQAIAPFTRDPALAVDAAEALARSPRADAAATLLDLARAKDPLTRRLAFRAATLRRALHEEAGSLVDLDAVAAAFASAPDPADRAVARAFLVVEGRSDAGSALRDPAAAVRRAVLAVAPFDRALTLAAASDADPVVRALAYAALEEHAPETVASAELTRRVREREIDAPLAARVLASRASTGASTGGGDDAVTALLHSPDPLIRREAVRGYAVSQAPDRSGRLADLAATETDVEVRRVAIAGLAAQPEPSAMVADILAGSARLDPDPLARALARGVRVADDRDDAVWLHSDRRPGGDPYQALLSTAATARALAFDDDGDALVLAVASGPKQLRLAPRLPAYEPPASPVPPAPSPPPSPPRAAR